MALNKPFEMATPNPVALMFVLKEPANIKNSPTKLPVPGNPIFDIVKNKKINVYKGIVCTNPP